MIWSGARAVTYGDQINRDAGPPKISSDLVPEARMSGVASVDLVPDGPVPDACGPEAK
jgi:hypothetical protein